MELDERILYKGTHQLLTEDKNTGEKTKWIDKKIVITQRSFMAFGPYNSIFEFCDCKQKIRDKRTLKKLKRKTIIKDKQDQKKAMEDPLTCI